MSTSGLNFFHDFILRSNSLTQFQKLSLSKSRFDVGQKLYTTSTKAGI